MTSNLRIFVVEFNFCGQQFPGKSLSTGRYLANKEEIEGLLGELTNGDLFFQFDFIDFEYESTLPLGCIFHFESCSYTACHISHFNELGTTIFHNHFFNFIIEVSVTFFFPLNLTV